LTSYRIPNLTTGVLIDYREPVQHLVPQWFEETSIWPKVICDWLQSEKFLVIFVPDGKCFSARMFPIESDNIAYFLYLKFYNRGPLELEFSGYDPPWWLEYGKILYQCSERSGERKYPIYIEIYFVLKDIKKSYDSLFQSWAESNDHFIIRKSYEIKPIVSSTLIN